MRSILLFIIIAVAIPFLFKRPWLGVLMWVLVSVMNPHRLTFGFAYAFQFAAIIAVITAFTPAKGPVLSYGGFTLAHMETAFAKARQPLWNSLALSAIAGRKRVDARDNAPDH